MMPFQRRIPSTAWLVALVLGCTPSASPTPSQQGAPAPTSPETLASEPPPSTERPMPDCAEWGPNSTLDASVPHWRSIHRIGAEHIAVSQAGDVWRYHDGQWSMSLTYVHHRWNDAWIDDAGHVLVVGISDQPPGEHAAILLHDGTGWTIPWRSQAANDSALNAARSVGVDEYLAVGNDGLIVRGRGSKWSVEASGTKAKLTGLWMGEDGRAFVVGMTSEDRGGGVILQHDGERWNQVAQGMEPLEDMWGTDAQHVYAVGGFVEGHPTDEGWSRAVVKRFDGETWWDFYVQPLDDGETFSRIGGNSSRDVFVLRTFVYADGGDDESTWSLHHYDGSAWTQHALGDGMVGALLVAPHEVTLATDAGSRRWSCLHIRVPASAD